MQKEVLRNGGGASPLSSQDKGFQCNRWTHYIRQWATFTCHFVEDVSSTWQSTKKAAFTLAEVLITLAIIGIVAALTIPTLVQNYQTRAWNTAATVFERKIEEALKTMNTQATLAGYKTTGDFVNELSKHVKITKICGSDEISECFPDKIYWDVLDISKNTSEADEEIDMANIHTAEDLGQKNWGTEAVGIQFANGTTGVIAYNPECKQDPYSNQITGTSCISLAYDTSGFKLPNTYGKDLRGINVTFLGKCAFKSNGVCFGTLFQPEPMTLADCQSQEGADLGITQCCTHSYQCSKGIDYWAGAVRTCGGVDKMPTDEQLTDIANALYGAEVGSSAYFDSKYNSTNIAAKIGFPETVGPQLNGDMEIWSSRVISDSAANMRRFWNNGTAIIGSNRQNSTDVKAICIIK